MINHQIESDNKMTPKLKCKIGVLTFSPEHLNLNPGSIFQAWSLCHFINNIPGLEAELIFYAFWKEKLFSGGIYSLPNNMWSRFRRWRCNSFSRKNIRRFPQKKPLFRENVNTVNGKYDMILVGSDQVWNTYLTGFDKTFFLDFCEGCKKGAYAPSIGREDWPVEIKPEIEDFLRDFEFIGVREKQAVQVVQALTEKTVHWSIDPTLLINKIEWSKIARTPKENADGFILDYCIIDNPEVVKAVEKAEKELNLPVIECRGVRKRIPSAIKKYLVGADLWLGYLLNSKVVITDSFHGVAFCVNNNKPFYVILTSNGNRITSLLELFGLKERIITSAEEMDFTKKIDWEPVNQKLEEVRKENQDWLRDSIFKAFEDNK